MLTKILTLLMNANILTSQVFAKVLLPSPSEPLSPNNVRMILIYGAMGIGNMVLFTPTLKAIRRYFSHAHITLLVAQSGCEEVVRGSSLVDTIVKAKPGYWEYLKLVKQIRDEKFDLLVSNFHGGTFRSVTLFSNIPYRAGHCTSPGWKNPSDFLYNIKVRMEECEHEVDRDLRLAKAIGIKDTDDSPMFHVSKKDRVSANNFLQQNDIRDGDLTVGIQIGTWHVQEWKRWDITKLALVCDRLIEDYGARVIVLGAPQHLKELETLLGSIKHEIVIALGKTTIKQSAAIVERCDFTICNDSGLMHITAAMGTPVIAIYGPTDYHRTSPCRYGELHIVIRKELECSPCFRMAGDEDNVISCPHRNCLESITVEDVLIAVKKVLAQKPKPLQK